MCPPPARQFVHNHDMPQWHQLDCTGTTKAGRCVGLRIASAGAGEHELVILLQKPSGSDRAPPQAAADRIVLDGNLEARLHPRNSIHISKANPNGQNFSLTLHASVQPPPRGAGGEGYNALEAFVATLRQLTEGGLQLDSPDGAPTFEAILKAHEQTVRSSSQPAARRGMPKIPGGHKAKSTLGASSVGSSASRSPVSEIAPKSFYRDAGRDPSMPSMWGSKMTSAGTRQVYASHATSSAPAPLGPDAPPHQPQQTSQLHHQHAPYASSRLAGSGAPSQHGVAARAMHGAASPAGGPKFGYGDDDGPRSASRRPDGLERPPKQQRTFGAHGAQYDAPSRPPHPADAAHEHRTREHAPAHGSHALAVRGSSGTPAGVSGAGGFRNIGNTCYINAVLSALLGLRPFVTDVLSSIPLFAPRLDQSSLFSALSAIMHQRQVEGDDKPATPRRLKDAIARRSAQFAGFAQQDAHEFLADCLDGLQEEMMGALKEVSALDKEITPPLHPAQTMSAVGAAAAAIAAGESSTTPATAAIGGGGDAGVPGGGETAVLGGGGALPSDGELPCAINFTTEVEHELTCTQCGHRWCRGEVMRHFSLDLPSASQQTTRAPGGRPPPSPDLQSLLSAFFADDAVEVACERCDGHTATVTHRISKLPRVLTLHLKRFDHTATGVRKRLDPVRPLPALSLKACSKPGAMPPPPLVVRPSVAAAVSSASASSQPAVVLELPHASAANAARAAAAKAAAAKAAEAEPPIRAADSPGMKAPRRALSFDGSGGGGGRGGGGGMGGGAVPAKM